MGEFIFQLISVEITHSVEMHNCSWDPYLPNWELKVYKNLLSSFSHSWFPTMKYWTETWSVCRKIYFRIECLMWKKARKTFLEWWCNILLHGSQWCERRAVCHTPTVNHFINTQHDRRVTLCTQWAVLALLSDQTNFYQVGLVIMLTLNLLSCHILHYNLTFQAYFQK